MSTRHKPSHSVVSPPPVESEADKIAWIRGGAFAQERKSADAQRRQFTRARDGAELRRLHVRIPVELERRLKEHCVRAERSAGAVVIEALTKVLGAG
jgi:hypothetical protein